MSSSSSPSSPSTFTNHKKFRILIGLTGSVACIKLPLIVEKLINSIKQVDICIISTQNALNFINIHADFNQIVCLKDRLNYIKSNNDNHKNCILTFTDADEWSSWSKRNDPVLHIDLRKWADLFLISPLDANTLGKLANGLCDNLLTCVARAWDFENKKIIICPAMNTFMYNHKITRKQLDMLVNEYGYVECKAIEKLLMCGDYGNGAMANVDDICNCVIENLNLKT